ncbi:hypothetical protein HanXRQr2_Chr17g0796251 [Helianthus annuus]|uniref:Uncharacterized protein n=1 Tax=Helianthus annuus TaxID=4232 RepID=A0A9K3DHS2_HELAN|nr:hypothetical protein HanXRQr2_Chr17g0796251 [Helianthus annuus]
MGSIVLFVYFELSRSVSDNLVSLHKNTTETLVRRITIHNEIVVTIGNSENRSISKHVLERLKTPLVRNPKQKVYLFESTK